MITSKDLLASGWERRPFATSSIFTHPKLKDAYTGADTEYTLAQARWAQEHIVAKDCKGDYALDIPLKKSDSGKDRAALGGGV